MCNQNKFSLKLKTMKSPDENKKPRRTRRTENNSDIGPRPPRVFNFVNHVYSKSLKPTLSRNVFTIPETGEKLSHKWSISSEYDASIFLKCNYVKITNEYGNQREIQWNLKDYPVLTKEIIDTVDKVGQEKIASRKKATKKATIKMTKNVLYKETSNVVYSEPSEKFIRQLYKSFTVASNNCYGRYLPQKEVFLYTITNPDTDEFETENLRIKYHLKSQISFVYLVKYGYLEQKDNKYTWTGPYPYTREDAIKFAHDYNREFKCKNKSQSNGNDNPQSLNRVHLDDEDYEKLRKMMEEVLNNYFNSVIDQK